MVEYHGDRLLAISYTFIVLIIVFLIGRIISRQGIKKQKLGLDDYCLLCGVICSLTVAALGIVLVKVANVGYHYEDAIAMDPNTPNHWAKVVFSVLFVHLGATSIVKLSILALYLRVFTVAKTWFKISVYILIALTIAYLAAFAITNLFLCVPLRGFWDSSIRSTCINIHLFFNLLTVPGIVLDIPMLLIPIPVVAKIQTSGPRKLGILSLFICGSLGLIAACIRTILFFKFDALEDRTWNSVYLMGIVIVEPALYSIAACMMAMRPLFDYVGRMALQDKRHRISLNALVPPVRQQGSSGPSSTSTIRNLADRQTFDYKPSSERLITTISSDKFASQSTASDEIKITRDIWVDAT